MNFHFIRCIPSERLDRLLRYGSRGPRKRSTPLVWDLADLAVIGACLYGPIWTYRIWEWTTLRLLSQRLVLKIIGCSMMMFPDVPDEVPWFITGAFPLFPKCSGSKPRWPGNLNLQKPWRTSHFDGEIPWNSTICFTYLQIAAMKSHSWTTLNKLSLVEHRTKYFFPIFSSKLSMFTVPRWQRALAPRLCEGRGRRPADPCLHGVHPCRRRGSEIRPGRPKLLWIGHLAVQKTHGFHPTYGRINYKWILQ